MKKLLIKVSALALVLANSLGVAFAQSSTGNASPALYQGADRHERLVEAAKKEGEVSVYHSAPIEDITAVGAAFTKKYGIRVKNWRASSESVLQRVVNEARGGRADVDLVENNAPENEALHRENLLQEVRSPYIADLVPQASPAHKNWIGTTFDVFVAAYHTGKVKKEELPKTYQDLLNPRWKDRLGVEAEDHHWFATVLEEMGEQRGLKLFQDIVAMNGVSVRKGHTLLANLVASGEVPLALTAYNWRPQQLKEQGAPIDWYTIPPAVAQFRTLAMLKKAPHPNAAVLFYDFMLNEGQQILAGRSLAPTSKKIDSPFSQVQLKFIDPGRALDMQEKWRKTYEEVVIKKTK